MIEFINAIRAVGFEPPGFIEPGKIHRFPGMGKPPSNRAGWCILFKDLGGGVIADYSSGYYEVWQAKRDKPRSRQERVSFARRVQETKKVAEAEQFAKQTAAADRAARIWEKAKPAAPDHPYLLLKQIQLHGVRIYKDSLVIPIRNFAGEITSLQFIDNDGKKRLLTGGRKQGCFIPVTGDFTNPDPDRVVICEGWATGCTLAESEPNTLVLAAIDAGNLESVAVGLRCRCPRTELVIAGDDDRLTKGNPGATKARKAAIASSALLALPQWPDGAPDYLSDFNDLAVWLEGSYEK